MENLTSEFAQMSIGFAWYSHQQHLSTSGTDLVIKEVTPVAIFARRQGKNRRLIEFYADSGQKTVSRTRHILMYGTKDAMSNALLKFIIIKNSSEILKNKMTCKFGIFKPSPKREVRSGVIRFFKGLIKSSGKKFSGSVDIAGTIVEPVVSELGSEAEKAYALHGQASVAKKSATNIKNKADIVKKGIGVQEKKKKFRARSNTVYYMKIEVGGDSGISVPDEIDFKYLRAKFDEWGKNNLDLSKLKST